MGAPGLWKEHPDLHKSPPACVCSTGQPHETKVDPNKRTLQKGQNKRNNKTKKKKNEKNYTDYGLTSRASGRFPEGLVADAGGS